MKAMLLTQVVDVAVDPYPLQATSVPEPTPGAREILIRVSACGVCHTELDEIEGRTPPARYPVIPGHQVVGRVETLGPGCSKFQPGDRVGVAWIFSACEECASCRSGNENLCARFRATGRDANGGYAEYMVVPESFAYPIPPEFSDGEAAPLLCAGAIGYRSLRLASLGDTQSLGLVGFGASAHLVLKLVQHLHPQVEIYVFSRSKAERNFACDLGAVWTGGFDTLAPQPLDRIIDTTPAWSPVLAGLANLAPGGRLVINAIRKEATDQEALLHLDYPRHLWMEKEIRSVANVTRQDVSEFLGVAAQAQIRPEWQAYTLDQANLALYELKTRKIRGAKVLMME